jgi:hypothetical protein
LTLFVFSNDLPFLGASFFSSDGHVLFVRQQGNIPIYLIPVGGQLCVLGEYILLVS